MKNLQIKRIAVHEVFQRGEDGAIVPPQYGDRLEELSAEARTAFQVRMTDALSAQRQSLKMDIVKHDAGSCLSIAEKILGSSDDDFMTASNSLADKLAEAQISRRIPGGMVVVFDGTVGADNHPLTGVIKAETQAGFRRSVTDRGAAVEFLKDIFLTPATRLYKVGLFVENDKGSRRPNNYSAYVFDSNITANNRESAARYFFEGFLGCALPKDGAYYTAKFFDITKEFIKKSDIDVDSKRSITDSLYVYIRDEKSDTFTVDEFSDRYLPTEMRDIYSSYLERSGVPMQAIVRDASEMGTRLRRRVLTFKGGHQFERFARGNER